MVDITSEGKLAIEHALSLVWGPTHQVIVY